MIKHRSTIVPKIATPVADSQLEPQYGATTAETPLMITFKEGIPFLDSRLQTIAFG